MSDLINENLPEITDAPGEIWLCYGSLEQTETHAAMVRNGEVLWCEDSQEYSDVRYVRADGLEAQAKRIAELEARLKQVEGDAGRYRWLRKGSPKSNRLPHITQYQYQAKIDENKIPQVWDIEGYHPERLDEAIDAAIKEQA